MAGRSDVGLALCGDVMLGRGIDQILPAPSDPILYEEYAQSALDYVRLAESRHGPVPRPVSFDYVWGDLLADLAELSPRLRIANLETSVTTSSSPYPKGINYRMNPANVGCLEAASFDCCVLANNHVLDWGTSGLEETIAMLERAHIEVAGAGRDAVEAGKPAVLPMGERQRLLVFAYGSPTSGVPLDWAATRHRPGVNLLPDLTRGTARHVAGEILGQRDGHDLVVVSIHWGSNWGYTVTDEQRDFAHALVDAGACDLVHGHSSHHPRPIEVYRDRLILYGCGDFLNDYEGIRGHEQYRGDLVLMYLPRLAPDGALIELALLPYRIRRFRLERASGEEAGWLAATLSRESKEFGCQVAISAERRLTARWSLAGDPLP